MKCLEKEPERRYASAEALAKDLRRFLDDRPTHARPLARSERLRLWGKRNPAVAGLVAALAVVLLAAFATVSALWVKAEGQADSERVAKRQMEEAAQQTAAALLETQKQKLLAEQAQADAKTAADRAEKALLEMKRQKSLLEFGRGIMSCEEGRVEEGLQFFLRAAEIAEETGQTELARVARINLAAWPRDLPPAPRPFAHKQQPRLAAFHPDGKRFVTAGRGGELYLWEANPARKIRTYKPARRGAFLSLPPTYWTVAISPDGKTVAAGGTDAAITLWDINSPEPKLSFDADTGGTDLWSLGFTPDGALWSNRGGGLNRWDLSAKPSPKAMPVPAKESSDILQILTVSADGKRIYTGDRGAVVREWDAEKQVELRSWRFRAWITDVAVSSDGARLAATGPEGVVWVIDLASGAESLSLSLAGAYGNGVAFAPKRPFIVACDGDGNVRFWHRDTGQPVGIPRRFQGEVTRPRFRSNSDEFAVPAGDSVYLSGVPDPPGDLLSAGHGERIRGLDFSPKGDQLAVTDEKVFELFDLRTRKPVGPPLRPRHGALSLGFDPDPSRPFVYRGTRQGFDRVAVPGGTAAEEAQGSAMLGRVYRIECLRGDGGLFVMGQGVVARYDPATLKVLVAGAPAANVPPGVDLDAMAGHPRGKEVLVAFADRIVFLDGRTLKPIREWRTGDAVLSACYTPDGGKVLLGRRDNKAELLDAATGRAAAPRAMTHTRAVAAVAVSPDGKVLLTGSRDGTARFWDAATGLPLGAPMRHSGSVTHAAFSPKGDHVATGTGTGHVMIWDLPPPPEKDAIEELKLKFSK
jgi:WD40 repeat protein